MSDTVQKIIEIYEPLKVAILDYGQVPRVDIIPIVISGLRTDRL